MSYEDDYIVELENKKDTLEKQLAEAEKFKDEVEAYVTRIENGLDKLERTNGKLVAKLTRQKAVVEELQGIIDRVLIVWRTGELECNVRNARWWGVVREMEDREAALTEYAKSEEANG